MASAGLAGLRESKHTDLPRIPTEIHLLVLKQEERGEQSGLGHHGQVLQGRVAPPCGALRDGSRSTHARLSPSTQKRSGIQWPWEERDWCR